MPTKEGKKLGRGGRKGGRGGPSGRKNEGKGLFAKFSSRN